MSETESDKEEALGATWAYDKVYDFTFEKHIVLETDHTPLVQLLGIKDLNQLPPCILKFRSHLDRFSFDINHILHVPGKQLYITFQLTLQSYKN